MILLAKSIVACAACFLIQTPLRAQEPDPYRPPAIRTQDVPVVPRELIEHLRQYQNVRFATFAGWSPDGNGILIRTRFGETSQLHRVYAPGGRREQITFFGEPAAGRFIPHDHTGDLLISMGVGGSENDQIYRLCRTTGRTTMLTDGVSRNLLGPLADDGSRFVISSTRRNGRDTDLYLTDPKSGGSRSMLLQADGDYWVPHDFSRDGKWLLVNRYVSINESYPAILDVASGRVDEQRRIAVAGQKHAYDALAFAADGKSVLMAADLQGEFRQLFRVTFDGGQPVFRLLTKEVPWDVTSVEVAENGATAFTANQDGASGLYLLQGDSIISLEVPLGVVEDLNFSPDARQLGFTLARPDSPDDAYSLELATRKLTRWTYSETGGLNPETFISPQQIQVTSFDGLTVPAYYFKPRSASPEKPAAVLIHIHGGPESQYRPNLSVTDQSCLNELGIAVIRPNVRGSAGYGRSYLLKDNGPFREDSVKDIGAILDWIAANPELDQNRVAVIGASYGGYMVLGCLTNFPDRIKAGIDIVGVANFTTFLQNTSEYRRDLRRAEYGDERDPEMQRVFERINPTANAHQITSALLVAHGRNDPRVPFSEAVQIAEKVRANGHRVWTVYADNEGHGFQKKANADYLSAVIALFLQTNL